ncbi:MULTISPECIES: hemin ABC transporter substrate-binding protein [Achromobacter]|uniref:Hemin ABC transporter substrate-binding protein n=2 Tax=Alcaligenes xylosoxydans xylosoxydans TaxID=85698 RepID=A0A424W4A7_ALCXX|nr:MULTISPECIES: ABC transporter substrate-binding protein [Achromobacter]MBC9908453.1 ABC transporter substrate-binding protein [Achromobacter xylosoxidans]MBD0872660.1 ABC transporter substrate-binding protein [Achromobacter xylosoxidans]QNP87096.1 ABC transporter substrate-binding protein [Achromobacter xylosoxidans]RPJ88075.1 hemin ABC transporter substrate-binding protein [Achromobacter xylosoxidans]WLW63050.1 ABC transporter substrate-binding protein [Achromobacter aegrifaciens]
MKKWLAMAAGWAIALGAYAAPPARVVTLGGTVTEIVYQLGQGGKLVGDDLSSLYPEAATRLPRVGYYRSVPVEGVLSLKPDLVLASEQAGPPDSLKRLADVGVRVVTVSDAPSVDSLKSRIRGIADALGVAPAGERMVEDVTRELARAEAVPATRARALLLINRTGSPQGAGRDTAANEVMHLAGLVNVLQDQHGYKPLSAEAMGALAPDLIIVTQASLDAGGGMDAFLRMPGIASTQAAAKRRIVVMDDLLILGMGPRLPLALTQLKQEVAHVMAR